MRTCKVILRCVRKFYRLGTPDIYELAHKTGLHPTDVMDACKILEKDGYLEYTYQVVNGKTSSIPGGVRLTLKGRKPVEYFWSQLKEYFKRNWIAIAALIISIVSLLQSLGIISIPLPI